MFGARLVGGDKRKVHFRLHRRRQFDFCFLGALFQPLKREAIGTKIDPGFFFELVRKVMDEKHVEIFAAEEGIAIGRLHLEDAVANFKDGNIEGAAAQIIDGDRALLLLVQAIGKCRRGRLVDDAKNFEAGNFAGIFGCLALRVVKIGRDCNNGLGDFLAKMGFSGLFHFLQYEGGNFGRGEFFGVAALNPGIAIGGFDDFIRHHPDVFLGHRIVEAPADQSLDGEESMFGVGNPLAFCRLAGKPFVVAGECDNGRGCPPPFGVLDNLWGRALHNRDAGIGGPKVDTDDFRHIYFLLPANGHPATL